MRQNMFIRKNSDEAYFSKYNQLVKTYENESFGREFPGVTKLCKGTEMQFSTSVDIRRWLKCFDLRFRSSTYTRK